MFRFVLSCLNHRLHRLHGENRLLFVRFSFNPVTTNQRYECLRAFPAVRNRTYQRVGKIGDRNLLLQKNLMLKMTPMVRFPTTGMLNSIHTVDSNFLAKLPKYLLNPHELGFVKLLREGFRESTII